MQNHRKGVDRSDFGQSILDGGIFDAGAFQDGYFRIGEQGNQEHLVGTGGRHPESDRDAVTTTKSRQTTHSSLEQSPASFSPWTPYTSNGDTSPTQSFCTSSLGLNSSDHWDTVHGRKGPSLTTTVGSNRGPLDVCTSPISSPVSSSEYSTNKTSTRDYATMEAHWSNTQSGHHPFVHSTNNLRVSAGEWMRGEEEEATAAYRQSQSMRSSFDLANRLAGSQDLQRAHSLGQGANLAPNRMSQGSTWPISQRGQQEVETNYDAHARSAHLEANTLASRLSHPSLISGSETTLYKSYQVDPRLTDQSASPPLDSLAEFSIFVGDLSPELREEDLVAQFIQPSAWPASHPFAIAHAHAQQVKGNFSIPAKIRPAPFTSTKSAKIMKDPLTGASRGFGFVRFSKEEDCARALIEMQGMVINPIKGPGRPLRVCTATPKNRTASTSVPGPGWNAPSLNEALNMYQQLQQHHERLASPIVSSVQDYPVYKNASPTPFSPTASNYFGYPSTADTSATSASTAYSNSALDPNNTTVFVGGLSSLISEETLKTFFAPFGEIIYVKIPPGKGCGFVQFVKKVDAERAIERMQGFPIGGGRIRLSWGRSQGDKAAAAAAQAVAQTAQITQLASLASLSGMSPAQLSHLAGMNLATTSANPSGEANTLLIRRLAAAAAAAASSSAVMNSHEKEHIELQRAASIHQLPAMEHQHLQAQRQLQHNEMDGGGGLNINYEVSSQQTTIPPYPSSQWTERESSLRNNDDYLASLFPSLRLDQLEQARLSPTQRSRADHPSPLMYDSREHQQPLPSLDARKMQPLRQSSIFSPFSPPISPSILEDLTVPCSREDSQFRFSESTEQSHHPENDNDSPFKRYLESERQKQHQAAQQHSPTQVSLSSQPGAAKA